MNIKKVIGAIGLLATGYEIGKISGAIKLVKFELDCAEEAFPGAKRTLAEALSDAIIDAIFKDNKKKKEGS